MSLIEQMYANITIGKIMTNPQIAQIGEIGKSDKQINKN